MSGETAMPADSACLDPAPTPDCEGEESFAFESVEPEAVWEHAASVTSAAVARAAAVSRLRLNPRFAGNGSPR
ncbi:hypothetical protein ACWELB_12925 [Streptomyces asiaticus]